MYSDHYNVFVIILFVSMTDQPVYETEVECVDRETNPNMLLWRDGCEVLVFCCGRA